MSGTTEGALKAMKTNIERYGKDFYSRIGKLGGKKSRTGGFYHMAQTNPELHRKISAKGGRVCR